MRRISWREVIAVRWAHMKWGRLVLGVLAAIALCPATAAGATTLFSYTGGEQTYTVPVGVTSVSIVAIGGPGGGTGGNSAGGRAADVSGVVDVTPGEVLYVEVGGGGGLPSGGWNGGGDGGSVIQGGVWGGGGASDVRTIPMSAGAISLTSRLIVAAGGGGADPPPGIPGGDAGKPGDGDPQAAGGPGTLTAGGAGGCGLPSVGCGEDGTIGIGGAGGHSGTGTDNRFGPGGGGGLYGGGGGGAAAGGYYGTGGGGSSEAPFDLGTMSLASLTTTPRVAITPVPAPSCRDTAMSTSAGRPLVVQLMCTEYAAKRLTYRIVVPPAHGTLTAVGLTGQVVYKPAAGFSGIDSFTYDASSTNGSSNVQTISIAVGPNPAAIAGRGRANKNGVQVPVACTGAPGAHCRLTVAMTEKDVTVGRRSIVIPAGMTKVIRVALNSAGRQLLSSHGNLRVSLVVTQIAGSKHEVVSRQTLTLKTSTASHWNKH
jgi:Bacterial Ig domain/Glycine rich protein